MAPSSNQIATGTNNIMTVSELIEKLNLIKNREVGVYFIYNGWDYWITAVKVDEDGDAELSYTNLLED